MYVLAIETNSCANAFHAARCGRRMQSEVKQQGGRHSASGQATTITREREGERGGLFTVESGRNSFMHFIAENVLFCPRIADDKSDFAFGYRIRVSRIGWPAFNF